MRIAIIGQQEFGKSVLEAFLARGDTVAGVFVAPEKPGARPDPLRVAAEEKGLAVFQFPSYRKPDAQEALRRLEVDLGVMAYVLLFAPQDFVRIPRHGTIQYHPSLLPRHRGPSSINWPMIAMRMLPAPFRATSAWLVEPKHGTWCNANPEPPLPQGEEPG